MRLAPAGTLYVVEEFSVPIEGGIHGFPPGKKVRIVSRNGDQVTVADGDVEATQPAGKFTNDMDHVEKMLVSRAASAMPTLLATEATQLTRPDPIPTPSERKKRLEALKKQHANVKYRLDRLKIEIDNFGASTGSGAKSEGDRKFRAPVQMLNERDKLARELQVIELNWRTLDPKSAP